MPNPSHLIVGLGNPGSEYENTRHNIGFMAVDAIAERYGLPPWKKKFKSLITGGDFLLQKPLTYMNLSGEAVGEAMRFHKLAPENVIVFHDDLDLLPGQVRIKQGGGAGGHNGLKSLDAHIGPDYWRIRIGIGHPGVKGDAVTNYVLGPFAKADGAWVEPLLDNLAKEFDVMLDGKTDAYLKRASLVQDKA
ncbi:MAG: aminoacyl-tRNA hydrolase [Bdellovibrionales bacterium]